MTHSFCSVFCSILLFPLDGLGQIVWSWCDQVLLLVAACCDFSTQFWGGDEAEAALSQEESASEAADVLLKVERLFSPSSAGLQREDWTQGLSG